MERKLQLQIGKNWCFTLNNPNPNWKTEMEAMDPYYLIVGQEVAPTTGTPHLQGFVQFKKSMRLKAVTKLIPGAHLEIAKGSAKQNIQYCTKTDPNPFTLGTPPKSKGDGNKIRWDEAKQAAQEGRFEDIPAELQWRFYRTMKEMAKDNMEKPEPLDSVCGIWIYGKTGTGKTHSVVTQHPDRYIKPINKWWDGYQNEEVIHIDELSPEHSKWIAPYLKKWADKWPFDAEVKGGSLQLRPKKIIVTSNYSMDEMDFNHADFPALARRFKQIEKTREQDIII
jgi:hypothetical protein